MKKLAFLFLAGLSFCSSPVRNFKLFQGKTAVKKTARGFQLSSTVKLANFQTEKLDSLLIAHLSYAVHLLTPKGDTLFDVDNGMIDQSNAKKMDTLIIKSKIELDSSFTSGDYSLIFDVQDNVSGRNARLNVSVPLKN